MFVTDSAIRLRLTLKLCHEACIAITAPSTCTSSQLLAIRRDRWRWRTFAIFQRWGPQSPHYIFITCSCYHRQRWLGSEDRRDRFCRCSRKCVGAILCSGRLRGQPEDIHLLISEPEKGNPSRVMQAIKQGFARRVLRLIGQTALAQRRSKTSPQTSPQPAPKELQNVLFVPPMLLEIQGRMLKESGC